MQNSYRLNKSKLISTLILAIAAALIGFVAAKIWQGTKSIFISGRNPVAQIASFVSGSDRLIGENKGQVNILLLGIGGPGHDGPYLTDTIMVASLKPETHEAAFISIPRDTLATASGRTATYKLNAVYAYALESKGAKEAMAQTRRAVGEFLGIDIPYAFVVDFKGFEKAVDTLGGIDVEIEKSFTDRIFPDTRYGYLPAVSFKAGLEHMDGQRALIYARSRYSTSDYDRARRQQKIIEAFKARLKEVNLLRDLNTVSALYDNFTGHVSTNMDGGELKKLAQIGTEINQGKIYTSVLDPNTGLMCSYISAEKGFHLNLCPGKTDKDVKQYMQTAFARGHVKLEQPVIEIQNATGTSGLAAAAAEQLKGYGFGTTAAAAGQFSDPAQTMIYDLTDGQKRDSLAVLLTTLAARTGKTPPAYKSSTAPDFIVVLGRSYKPPFLDVINLDPPKPKEDQAESENNNDQETKEETEALPPATPNDTKTAPADKNKLLENEASTDSNASSNETADNQT